MFSAISGHTIRNILLNRISSSISSPFPQPHFRTASGRNPSFRNWYIQPDCCTLTMPELHGPPELLAFGSKFNQKILLYVRTAITLIYFTHSGMLSVCLILPAPICL